MKSNAKNADDTHNEKMYLSKKDESYFSNLKKKIFKKAKNSVVGFAAHSVVYIASNLFLFVINMLTSAGFPWFYFPLAFWGVGYISHFQHVRNVKRVKNQLLPIRMLNSEQIAIIRKIQNSESSIKQHITAFLTVNGALLGTNLITSPHFPWWLFPAFTWGIGLVSHLAIYNAKKKYLVDELKEANLSWDDIRKQRLAGFSTSGTSSEYGDIFDKANHIKKELLDQLKSDTEFKKHYGDQLDQLLNNFTSQIKQLIEKEKELEKVLLDIDEEEVDKALSSLKTKHSQTDSSYLREEYEKLIKQYEKQKKSILEVKNQKEVIYLRVTSAFTYLKQMQLDMTRMKNISSTKESVYFKELKHKSSELSEYIDDLKKSYKELDLQF